MKHPTLTEKPDPDPGAFLLSHFRSQVTKQRQDGRPFNPPARGTIENQLQRRLASPFHDNMVSVSGASVNRKKIEQAVKVQLDIP